MSETISFSEYQKAVQQATQRKSIIRDLEAKIATLTQQVTAITGERDEIASQFAALQEEHDSLIIEADDKLTELETSLGEWQQKYETAPSAHLQELNQLKEQIREQTHKSKFTEVASKLNLRKEAIDDAWGLSGYKVEGEEPDEAVITTALKGLVESRRYLLNEETNEPVGSQSVPGGTAEKPTAALRRGPGSDRGGHAAKPEQAVPAQEAKAAPWRAGNPFRIA